MDSYTQRPRPLRSRFEILSRGLVFIRPPFCNVYCDVSNSSLATQAGVSSYRLHVATDSEEVILRRVRPGGVISFVPLVRFLGVGIPGIQYGHADWPLIWARYRWCSDWCYSGQYERLPWWLPR